jgi:hypothetical protein
MKLGKTAIAQEIELTNKAFDKMVEITNITPEEAEKLKTACKAVIELADTRLMALAVSNSLTSLDVMTLRDLMASLEHLPLELVAQKTMLYLKDPETMID